MTARGDSSLSEWQPWDSPVLTNNMNLLNGFVRNLCTYENRYKQSKPPLKLPTLSTKNQSSQNVKLALDRQPTPQPQRDPPVYQSAELRRPRHNPSSRSYVEEHSKPGLVRQTNSKPVLLSFQSQQSRMLTKREIHRQIFGNHGKAKGKYQTIIRQ